MCAPTPTSKTFDSASFSHAELESLTVSYTCMNETTSPYMMAKKKIPLSRRPQIKAVTKPDETKPPMPCAVPAVQKDTRKSFQNEAKDGVQLALLRS